MSFVRKFLAVVASVSCCRFEEFSMSSAWHHPRRACVTLIQGVVCVETPDDSAAEGLGAMKRRTLPKSELFVGCCSILFPTVGTTPEHIVEFRLRGVLLWRISPMDDGRPITTLSQSVSVLGLLMDLFVTCLDREFSYGEIPVLCQLVFLFGRSRATL